MQKFIFIFIEYTIKYNLIAWIRKINMLWEVRKIVKDYEDISIFHD